MSARVDVQTKVVVTVAEMARMVGLSRARFYQLLGSAFPHPIYDVTTRRPLFTEELQQVCLEVRRRNCGMDGTPILFYARRLGTPSPKPKQVKPSPAINVHASLLDGLRSLGLVSATAADVATAVRELYPNGASGLDQGEVLRAVFLRIKRQNSADNVGR